MKKSLLLDTQAFIHSVKDQVPFPKRTMAKIEDPERRIFLSVATIWEMGIKISLGKLDFGLPLEVVVERALDEVGLLLLSITPRHIYKVSTLEQVHRDPFDRLLAAQAIEEELLFVSSDEIFDAYKVERIWN